MTSSLNETQRLSPSPSSKRPLQDDDPSSPPAQKRIRTSSVPPEEGQVDDLPTFLSSSLARLQHQPPPSKKKAKEITKEMKIAFLSNPAGFHSDHCLSCDGPLPRAKGISCKDVARKKPWELLEFLEQRHRGEHASIEIVRWLAKKGGGWHAGEVRTPKCDGDWSKEDEEEKERLKKEKKEKKRWKGKDWKRDSASTIKPSTQTLNSPEYPSGVASTSAPPTAAHLSSPTESSHVVEVDSSSTVESRPKTVVVPSLDTTFTFYSPPSLQTSTVPLETPSSSASENTVQEVEFEEGLSEPLPGQVPLNPFDMSHLPEGLDLRTEFYTLLDALPPETYLNLETLNNRLAQVQEGLRLRRGDMIRDALLNG
ncbi:hypothetical protein BDY24DRAFT_394896 [Mrakia frigida]|uniref:uncharacterized protein n=1 Tax=Mrakia frigida TaxID=29902 RepID=UPI003FCBF9EF